MSAVDNTPLLWLAFITLAKQATHDGLTGLYNRRYFDNTLSDHIAVAKRYDHELSLVLFDLDDFKLINDTQGHQAGDEALRQFAKLLESTARKADIICRYGGDEFAVILPETSIERAKVFVNRVLQALDKLEGIKCSTTTGLAALPCDDLVGTADTDLLLKKHYTGKSSD